jgi:hypothetical protein
MSHTKDLSNSKKLDSDWIKLRLLWDNLEMTSSTYLQEKDMEKLLNLNNTILLKPFSL